MLLSTGFIVQTQDSGPSNDGMPNVPRQNHLLRSMRQGQQNRQDQQGEPLMQAQVMPRNEPMQQERPEPRPFGPEQRQQSQRLDRDEILAQSAAAIGSDINPESIAMYAQQLAPAIASLSASPTPDDMKAIHDMLRNIAVALRELRQINMENSQNMLVQNSDESDEYVRV